MKGLQSLVKNPNFNLNNSSFFSARVKKIILDKDTYSELFNEYGEWSSMGLIFFEDSKNPSAEFDKTNFAYPLFPNIKNYPLENELVFIFKLSSIDIQGNPSVVVNYYITPINVWGSNHHNGIPDNIFDDNSPKSQQKDYQNTSEGNVRKSQDKLEDIDLGSTFKEKSNIKGLQFYEGDVIFEGRWGNSIRFSSTIKDAKIPNTWSEQGENGDPIVILRNGQYNNGQEPWIPIIEDINKDISQIYLTSNQQIAIDVASKNYNSYKTPPTSPNQYSKSQIILSSGRLVLNAKEDSLLFSAKKTINLNSVNSVNIDTKEVVLNTSKLFLGKKEATEPLLLGNKTIELFQKIFISLQELCNVLPTVGTPVKGTPNVAVTQAATKLGAILSQLIPLMPTLKSKQNFTI